MAKQPRLHPAIPHGSEKDAQKVEVTIGSAKDIPIIFANQMVVNFTGTEFLLSVVSAFPEPWTSGQQIPTKVEGKVLARYAFSVPQFVAGVKSISDLIDRLQTRGAFSFEELEQVKEETK